MLLVQLLDVFLGILERVNDVFSSLILVAGVANNIAGLISGFLHDGDDFIIVFFLGFLDDLLLDIIVQVVENAETFLHLIEDGGDLVVEVFNGRSVILLQFELEVIDEGALADAFVDFALEGGVALGG